VPVNSHPVNWIDDEDQARVSMLLNLDIRFSPLTHFNTVPNIHSGMTLPARTTCPPRMPLEDELTRLLKSVPSVRDRRLVRRILGWDGQGGSLIAKAGDEFGITRERARQVYSRAVEQIRNSALSPSLDKILRVINGLGNQSAEGIQAELRRRGLTRYGFDLQAFVKTARMFGRAPKFTLEEAGDKVFAVLGPGVTRSILKAAQQSISHYGVQTVSEMCAAINPCHRTSRDRLLVRQVLETRSDLRWLDADQQWFWLATIPRNPVVRCIKKLLAYAGSVTFADLHRAVLRLPCQPTTPMPLEALTNFCRQAPFCRIRGGSVELEPSFRSENLLGRAEAAVCGILKGNGSELSLHHLETLCFSAGVKRPNLWRIVLHSPLIFRSAPRTYRLIRDAGDAEYHAR
jgi:hypothetical protein